MKKLSISALSALSYAFLAPIAHAITVTPTPSSLDPCPPGTFSALCNLGGSTAPGAVLGAFISLFFAIAVIIAIIYLIYGGIKWITSKGEKTEVEAARNHIIAAITGLIMVFLAFFIINFLLGFFLPGFSLTNFKLPSLP